MLLMVWMGLAFIIFVTFHNAIATDAMEAHTDTKMVESTPGHLTNIADTLIDLVK